MIAVAAILVSVALAAPSEGKTAAPAADAPRQETLRRGDAYFHLMQARIALSRGRASDVASEVRAALDLVPDAPPLLAEAAGLLAVVGRRSEAEKLARRAVEIDPGTWAAVRVLADLAASRSFGAQADPAARHEAIGLYERIAKEDPDAPPEVLASIARLKLHAGDTAGAVSAARAFAAKRPADEGAIRLLVQSLSADGRIADASREALDWLARNPEAAELLPAAAELAREVGDWERLEATATTLLEAQPANPRLHGYRGEARLRLGRAREAVQDLEIARDGAPDEPFFQLHLAAAYGAANRLADAAALATRLAADFPDNPGIRSMLGETLARQGDLQGASLAFAAALRSIPADDPDAGPRRDEIRLRLAVTALARRDAAAAEAVLSDLEAPDVPEALELRARTALERGDLAAARSIAASLAARGEAGAAAAVDGEALLDEGKVAEARERFDEAIRRNGPAFRGRVAETLREAGETKAAEETLRGWVAAEPANPEARFRLGAFLDREGRFREAERELRESLRLRPRSPEVLNYLGYTLVERGEKLEEAVSLVERALDLDPSNGAYLDSLGWAYYRLGRYAEARGLLERASRELPKDGTILDHLGDVYQRLGETEKAKDAWKRALESGGDNVESVRRKLSSTTRSSEGGTPRGGP